MFEWLPQLAQFGNSFLAKLEGSVVNAKILNNINLVDTPGKRMARSLQLVWFL